MLTPDTVPANPFHMMVGVLLERGAYESVDDCLNPVTLKRAADGVLFRLTPTQNGVKTAVEVHSLGAYPARMAKVEVPTSCLWPHGKGIAPRYLPLQVIADAADDLDAMLT